MDSDAITLVTSPDLLRPRPRARLRMPPLAGVACGAALMTFILALVTAITAVPTVSRASAPATRAAVTVHPERARHRARARTRPAPQAPHRARHERKLDPSTLLAAGI